jgi:hypothetical protein
MTAARSPATLEEEVAGGGAALPTTHRRLRRRSLEGLDMTMGSTSQILSRTGRHWQILVGSTGAPLRVPMCGGEKKTATHKGGWEEV